MQEEGRARDRSGLGKVNKKPDIRKEEALRSRLGKCKCDLYTPGHKWNKRPSRKARRRAV